MVCYGLPSFAQFAMFSLYDKTAPSVFTFPQNFVHLVKMFREHTLGGICNVYMRHATTIDEEAAYAAKFNNSGNNKYKIELTYYLYLGQKWKVINFFDVNSMYVSTFNKDMPTGRGFEWTVSSNDKFKRKLIADKQYSMGCVEYMDYMNNDERFVNQNGERQYIQHAWNGAEVTIGPYPVDGYCVVDSIEYVLQFDGCFWVSKN